MAKNDPVLTYLKDIEFLPILLPREGVRPLGLLLKDGKRFEYLGNLEDVTQSTFPLPPVSPDLVTANTISGKKSSTVKLSIGLSLLGNIIKAFTGQTLDVSLGYKNAKTVTYEFKDVTVDTIDILKLDQYLTEGDFNDAGAGIEMLFLNNQIGVVTSTLRAKTFVIAAQGQNGLDVKVDLPLIQNVLDGKVEVAIANESDSKIAYSGTKAISFGIRAVQLFTKDGHYTSFDPFNVGSAALRTDEAFGMPVSPQVSPFRIDSAFIDLEVPMGAGNNGL